MVSVISTQNILEREFNIYGDLENPLFLAKDVAKIINHSDVSKMIKTVDSDEKVKNIVRTLGGNQEMWFLTEDGLYEVLMQSRMPIAKEFKKKVKQILKDLRLNKISLVNNTNDSEKDKQINDLVSTLNSLTTTINNVVSQNNILLEMLVKNSNVNIDTIKEEISNEEENIIYDEIETEILNFEYDIMKIQDFCKYINSKHILPKKIGVQVVNQLFRDNDLYDEDNTPKSGCEKYFSVSKCGKSDPKIVLTKEGMIMLYRLSKDIITNDYMVRRGC